VGVSKVLFILYAFIVDLDEIGLLSCLVKNVSDIMNTVLVSGEAYFHVSGYVNKQKCHCWASNNPHELQI
jgi:hypothetical protein